MARVLPPVPSTDPTTFCRLCFSGSNIHWVVRTRGTAVDAPFVRTIGECLGLWLAMDEDFPCAVCRECTERLDLITQFRDLCRLCDEALREKRVKDEDEGVLTFYDTPADRVWQNGTIKPEYYENDSDFENEPIPQESFTDANGIKFEEKQFRLSKLEKKAALDSYLETYNTWYESIKKTRDDDEETVTSPEAVQIYRVNNQKATNKSKPISKPAPRKPPPAAIFKCSECGSKFSSQTSLKQHMARHQRKTLISCKRCSIQFMTHRELEAHQKSSGCRMTKMVHVCQYCDRTFSRQGRYVFHLKNLHPGKPLPAGYHLVGRAVPVTTADTDYRFSSKPGFSNDSRFSFRKGLKPTIERNGHFAVILQPLSEDLLRKHMVPESSPVTRSYTCPACWSVFGRMDQFSDHLGKCPARQRAASPPAILGD